MKKLIRNVILLNLLALPSLLMFNDANPMTGEWNYTLNIVGVVYAVWFYNHIIKPIFKPFFNEEE